MSILLHLIVDCISQIFPVVSAQGQKAILSQLLELTPTNKLLWSSKPSLSLSLLSLIFIPV